MGCESRRRLVRIVPPIYGLWHCFTHTSCICNDIIACRNRVVGVVPLPTPAGLKNLRKQVKKLWPAEMLTPLTYEQALATYKGTKNKLYKRAYDSLLVEPLSSKDARIKAFVKAERFDPAEKDNPDPRMIQARDPRYNLALARYLRGIEHHVYSLKRGGLPVIVKCKNPQERAELFRARWAEFDDPVCISLDCSRWDKHVTGKVLGIELDFYQSFYPGDLELKQLLDWQRRNRCRTSNGLNYDVDGGRMSGDGNTASGNCTLAVGMGSSALEQLKIKAALIDDGDDLCMITERHNLARLLTELPRIFLEFGQELKIENIAFDLRDIVFCQSKITWNGENWTFARNWRKVLSQSCCGTKHWNDPNLVRPMMGLIGDCENAQHRGIPILQVFATRLRELSGGQRSLMLHLDSSYQYRVGSYQVGLILDLPAAEITVTARAEFERTWGVCPSEQLAIEQAIMKWTPGTVFRDVGPEMSRPWAQWLDPSTPNPTCL